MERDKTGSHNRPRKRLFVPGEAQPLLKGINLVQSMLEARECVCNCEGCPPWEHNRVACKLSCSNRANWARS